ncbi:hypothetical protein EMIT0357P_20154 [Pseudomonas marginalis]
MNMHSKQVPAEGGIPMNCLKDKLNMIETNPGGDHLRYSFTLPPLHHQTPERKSESKEKPMTPREVLESVTNGKRDQKLAEAGADYARFMVNWFDSGKPTS